MGLDNAAVFLFAPRFTRISIHRALVRESVMEARAENHLFRKDHKVPGLLRLRLDTMYLNLVIL